MKQKILLEAKRMAREAGYHDVKQLKLWNGFEIVEPIYTDDEIRFTGYPQYILVKNGFKPITDDVLMHRFYCIHGKTDHYSYLLRVDDIVVDKDMEKIFGYINSRFYPRKKR